MGIVVLLSGSASDVAILSHALSRSHWEATSEASTDGYHTVELAVRARPDIIITDPTVSRLYGPELIARLKDVAPGTPIVCWADSPEPEDAAELIRAGASGYLLKEDGPGEVIRSIGPILEGGAVLSPRIAPSLVSHFADGIHRERELSRSLADATIKVQEVTHSKAEFLANVSHELRTPVTIVKGVTHLLQEGRLPAEDARDFLGRMDRAVERLTGLVEEILSIADLDRGHVAFDLAHSNLTTLIRDVCERVAMRYPLIRVEMTMPDRLDAVVDPARIAEAVAQLVDNACRYSPTPSVVEVTLRRVDEGIVFSVSDGGGGLRREVAAQAFREPFVVGEESIRKDRSGVGLGLHLARRLILLHGGILWADPLPAGGTRVSFCIPPTPPGSGIPRGVQGEGAQVTVDQGPRTASSS